MKAIFSLVASLIIFSSCYTSKKAARQMDRAYSEHELIAAQKCSIWFPVITTDSVTKYVTSIDTVYKEGDTIWIECDSSLIAREVKPNNKVTRAAPFKCPPAVIITQHDSIFTTLIKENTAATRAATIERDQYKSRAAKWQVIGMIFICISGILGIVLFLKLKK